MRVYIITETQMQSLHDRLQLEYMKTNNILAIDDPERMENDRMYRAFNFVVHRWREEITNK